MEKSTKIIIGVVLMVIVIGVIYYYYTKKKTAEKTPTKSPDVTKDFTPPDNATDVSKSRLLGAPQGGPAGRLIYGCYQGSSVGSTDGGKTWFNLVGGCKDGAQNVI